MKKLAVLLSFLPVFMFVACDNKDKGQIDEGIWQYSESFSNYNNSIESARYAQMFTGATSANKTNDLENKWNVGGTDLGFPIYDYEKNVMYYAFGDTFATPSQSGAWRSNVLAIDYDYNIDKGFHIDDFYKGGSGMAKPIIEGKHNVNLDTWEVTKIPTGGVVVGDTIYIYYMSIRRWAGWLVNYCGVVKSKTDTLKFERVYDLTWVLTDGNSYVGTNVGVGADYNLEANLASLPVLKRDILELANQDVFGMNRTTDGEAYNLENGIEGEAYVSDLSNRIAPNFGQIFPIDGKDGYIYMMGIPGGRGIGTKMGRVKKEDIEKFSEYEYYTGMNDNKPVYAKGTNGLNAVFDDANSFVISERCAELSFSYNPYLNKWVSLNATGNDGVGMNFRTADNIYGPYGEPQTILHQKDIIDVRAGEQGSIYGGAIHEKMTKNNGKTFYFVMSQWMPIYNSGIVEVNLK